MLVIVVYIPNKYVSAVIEVMASMGAGHIGNYEAVAYKGIGVCQFRPSEGAVPFIGEVGKLEQEDETRVEMVCDAAIIKNVLEAMINTHPYEVVAYHVLEARTLADFS